MYIFIELRQNNYRPPGTNLRCVVSLSHPPLVTGSKSPKKADRTIDTTPAILAFLHRTT